MLANLCTSTPRCRRKESKGKDGAFSRLVIETSIVLLLIKQLGVIMDDGIPNTKKSQGTSFEVVTTICICTVQTGTRTC
jgi:hypothetical protein